MNIIVLLPITSFYLVYNKFRIHYGPIGDKLHAKTTKMHNLRKKKIITTNSTIKKRMIELICSSSSAQQTQSSGRLLHVFYFGHYYRKTYRGIPGTAVLIHGIYRGRNFEYRPSLPKSDVHQKYYGISHTISNENICLVGL